MTDLATNVLYYEDNVNILRRYPPDADFDVNGPECRPWRVFDCGTDARPRNELMT